MYISPSDLTATQLSALKALHEHDKPVPFSSGFAFVKGAPISWKILNQLKEYKLIMSDGMFITLTNAGHGIAKKFASKQILGYD